MFIDTWIFLKRNVGLVERSLHANKEINPFIPFDRTSTYDRQTDTDTGPLLAQRSAGQNVNYSDVILLYIYAS